MIVVVLQKVHYNIVIIKKIALLQIHELITQNT